MQARTTDHPAGSTRPLAGRPRKGGSAVADPTAREFLRRADPILGEMIDARPDFHPRAWLDELPPLDAFGTLIFQVIGQQLSVSATRTIVARLEQRFGGHLPSPQELLAVDPQELRASRHVQPQGRNAAGDRGALRR